MPASKYPYQHISLESLKGELWKDIPELEGDYCVSNFGRVKRNDLEVLCKDGKTRRLKARVMVPELTTSENKTVGDSVYFLRVKICRKKQYFIYSLSRLLYYLFVKEFDLQNHSLVVLAKDGNGKNVSLKNLALVDVQRKQQRIFERDRIHRTYYHTYEEFLDTGADVSANPFCKQVTQYSLDGRRIQTFPSIRAAALSLDVSESGITSVLKKRQVSSYGFVWSYEKKARIDVASIREAGRENYKLLRGQPVTQYSVKGEKIAAYISMGDAAAATGVNRSDIFSVINGKQQSAGGYIWRKGQGPNNIDVTDFIYGEELRAKRRWKPVRQYSSDGQTLVNTYPSVKAAAAAMGCNPAAISTAVGKKKTNVKGFVWKFS